MKNILVYEGLFWLKIKPAGLPAQLLDQFVLFLLQISVVFQVLGNGGHKHTFIGLRYTPGYLPGACLNNLPSLSTGSTVLLRSFFIRFTFCVYSFTCIRSYKSLVRVSSIFLKSDLPMHWLRSGQLHNPLHCCGTIFFGSLSCLYLFF